MLRLGLRLTLSKGANARDAVARCLSADGGASGKETCGWSPRLVLTSTPKPTRLLRGVLAEPGLLRTDAPTRANADHLAPGFLATMQALYGGTRRAAQELEGRVLALEGALFTAEMIAGARRAGAGGAAAPDRIVVAVDPPAGTLSGRARDACGIVVVGRVGWGREAKGVVLADRTASGLSPEGWAARVRRTAEAHAADRVVVETNQGGAMAEAVLRASGLTTPIRRVHASLGKAARAEPVAALYEQGRIAHVGGLEALEEELMGLGGYGGGDEGGDGGRSPDRADALVWAVTDLMLGGGGAGPRLRML